MDARIDKMWLETTHSQATIAVLLNVTPASLSRYIAARFSEKERGERKTRILAGAQSVKRLPSPSWYTGPGKSVPERTIEYCKAHGLTALPPKATVHMLDGDQNNFSPSNMILLNARHAKQIREVQQINQVLQEKIDGIHF